MSYFNSRFHNFMYRNGVYFVLAAICWIASSWLLYSPTRAHEELVHDTCWVRGDHLFVAADEACDIINGRLANCRGARVECHLDVTE